MYVAAGGNGYSAMCSDALGSIAAHAVINGSFPDGFNESDFKPISV
ncbi:MAG: hypothetical protein ABIR19_07015 [Ginsengibacter sp.]